MPAEDPWFQSTHPNAPVSVEPAISLELTLVHPPELAGTRFPLRPGLIIGRAPEEQTIAIAHATISRRHAGVRLGMGGLLCIEDLGSRNGTKINGVAPELPTPLQPQTLVRFGDVHGVVDLPSTRRFDEDPVLPGTSPLMALARQKLEQAAPSNAPVLIVGETGTGKERLAHEVHRLSGRRDRYVTLNCAELSPQLIESQLFGHERGAFTGATTAKAGLFSAAHGGTLFLDEIGELRPELQPKLLRVLQEGEVRRVGSVSTERVDVRIVAATHRELATLAEQDLFRRDLLARLAFHEIRLPPLRARRQDILPWISLLAAAYAQQRGVSHELTFTPDAVERLLLSPWPDNLRGLDRLVHRSSTASGSIGVRALQQTLPELFVSDPVRQSSAPPELAAPRSPSQSAPRSPSQPAPSREEFLKVWEGNGRSVRSTAKHFGKERRQIYRWLERFGIAREQLDDQDS